MKQGCVLLFLVLITALPQSLFAKVCSFEQMQEYVLQGMTLEAVQIRCELIEKSDPVLKAPPALKKTAPALEEFQPISNEPALFESNSQEVEAQYQNMLSQPEFQAEVSAEFQTEIEVKTPNDSQAESDMILQLLDVESTTKNLQSDPAVIQEETVFHLSIQVIPRDASIRFLNHKQKFQQGMQIKSGWYPVEVSRLGYIPVILWITMIDSDIKEQVQLKKKSFENSDW